MRASGRYPGPSRRLTAAPCQDLGGNGQTPRQKYRCRQWRFVQNGHAPGDRWWHRNNLPEIGWLT
eukprot:6189958-Lingulodinium_polyedra.AAC.1